jgi:glycosyltransferase involved in cell wall biosynthesis
MRIAMLCSGHPVTDERVTYKQAVSLVKQGHEVIVFGRGEGEPTVLAGVAMRPLMPMGGGLIARARMIPKLTQAALEWTPDVVTCHEPESTLAGLRVKRRTGARVIFDVHEFFHESLSGRLPWPLRPVVRVASAVWLRHLGRRVDYLTAVSPPLRDFYLAVQPPERVDLIYNSSIVALFPLCHQDVAGPVTVCHDGFLGVGRGMVQLLEALALARREADVRLLVVGRVQPEDQTLFDEKLAALGLKDAIDLPGWVRYDKVGELLSRGQIGIVAMQPTPNNYGGLSNKIFNYMCCAQAVIVPRGSATADLVRDADCGLAVDTTRPEEIAGALVSLVRDPVLRQRLGANGRRAIEQEYGWHMMEKRLIEIYAQLK